jgi:hypothetical protein
MVKNAFALWDVAWLRKIYVEYAINLEAGWQKNLATLRSRRIDLSTQKLPIGLNCVRVTFLGQQPLVPFLILGPPFFRLFFLCPPPC